MRGPFHSSIPEFFDHGYKDYTTTEGVHPELALVKFLPLGCQSNVIILDVATAWPPTLQMGVLCLDFFSIEGCIYFYQILQDALDGVFSLDTILISTHRSPLFHHFLHFLGHVTQQCGSRFILEQKQITQIDGTVMQYEVSSCQSSSDSSFLLVLTCKFNLLMTADIKWSNLLGREISKRARNQSYRAYFSTLGGAYATLLDTTKAIRYANALLKVSIEDDDKILNIRSRIFLVLAEMQQGAPLENIRARLNSLQKEALEMKIEEVIGLVRFGFHKLEERKKAIDF